MGFETAAHVYMRVDEHSQDRPPSVPLWRPASGEDLACMSCKLDKELQALVYLLETSFLPPYPYACYSKL